MAYKNLSLKVTGFRKKETDGGCEDAFKTRPFQGGLILSSADGHGDARCVYAHVGSALACEVAVKVLYAHVSLLGRRSASVYFNEKRGEIAKEIVLAFRHAVLEDFSSRYPIPDSQKEEMHALIDRQCERERTVIGKEDAARERKAALKKDISDIVFLYGTTLRASVLTDSYAFNLAVGDGDTVGLLENGEAVWLLPKSEAFDNRTESMCEEPLSLLECFYFSFVPLAHGKKKEDAYALRALALSTDGLRNSFFSDGGYTDFLFSVSKKAEECGAPYARTLRRRLETLTRNSCYGDDITLSLAYISKM